VQKGKGAAAAIRCRMAHHRDPKCLVAAPDGTSALPKFERKNWEAG
jgi:hypothetical protein